MIIWFLKLPWGSKTRYFRSKVAVFGWYVKNASSFLHGKLYPCIKHFKYAGISIANKLRKENSLFPVLSLVQVSKHPTVLHRSRMDILSDILQVAQGGARKTEIMHQCNLSFKQLRAYLDLLVSMGLLKSTPPEPREKRNSNTYETTAKGRAFIQAYRNLTVLLTGWRAVFIVVLYNLNSLQKTK